MNKTKIEWTDYTWNPVIGCKHGCSYCYAKRMNDRFKWIPKWDEPQCFTNRLREPYKKMEITDSLIKSRIKKGWKKKDLNSPIKIFVGSICDLFGDWVSQYWINATITAAKNNPQYTFQFLTKNPKRYLEFEFPKNCWLGVTIDGGNENTFLGVNLDTFKLRDLKMKDNYKFISFEPLLGDVSRLDLSRIDLVIVGAMTGRGAIKPKKEWIDSIKHPNIFYKNNIKKYLKTPK